MIQRLISRAGLLAIATFAITSNLIADSVTTLDGSKLIGQIVKIEDGVIELETSYAGLIKIKQTNTSAISTDSPIFVEFDGGNTLYGTVNTAGSQVEVVAQDGQFSSSIDRISATWQEGTDSPQVRKLQAELAEKQRKWQYEAAAELTGNTGNSESLSTGISLAATLSSKEDKLKFYGSYNYGETDDAISVDNAKAGVRYDNTFADDYFWYARSELGRDAVQDLDIFNVTGAGLGYKLIQKENQNLSVNAGLLYRFESYGNGTDISAPAGDFGIDHDYTWENVKLINHIEFIPSFDDFADYRINHESSIEFPLGTSKAWKIRAGIAHRYHSEPSPGNNELDTNYFTRLVLSWK